MHQLRLVPAKPLSPVRDAAHEGIDVVERPLLARDLVRVGVQGSLVRLGLGIKRALASGRLPAAPAPDRRATWTRGAGMVPGELNVALPVRCVLPTGRGCRPACSPARRPLSGRTARERLAITAPARAWGGPSAGRASAQGHWAAQAKPVARRVAAAVGRAAGLAVRTCACCGRGTRTTRAAPLIKCAFGRPRFSRRAGTGRPWGNSRNRQAYAVAAGGADRRGRSPGVSWFMVLDIFRSSDCATSSPDVPASAAIVSAPRGPRAGQALWSKAASNAASIGKTALTLALHSSAPNCTAGSLLVVGECSLLAALRGWCV